MKSYQRKVGWLVAITAATAMWTACTPSFSDDVCTSKTDCFADQACVENVCVFATAEDDAGNDANGNNTDRTTPNACGGLSALENKPREPCGPCNLDKYICDDAENTVCNGDTACPEIAIVTTNPSDIAAASATFNGQIQELSNDLPTDHGFCWSAELLPTKINGSCHSLGALTAADKGKTFQYAITTLNPGTNFHVRVFHTDSTGTVFANQVDFTTLAPVPTNFTASAGSETAFIKLAWDTMPGATQYNIFRDDILLNTVGSEIKSLNDEDTEAGALLAAQNPAASQGTSFTAVVLTASPALAPPEASHTYKISAKYPDTESAHSPEAEGYRGVGTITYQWERSASATDADFSPLPGANALNIQDSTAPLNGDKRFYRLVANAPGVPSQTSSHVSGFINPLPSVSSVKIADVTESSAKASATVVSPGHPAATSYGFCIGPDPNPTTNCQDIGPLPADGLLTKSFNSLTIGTKHHTRAYLAVGGVRHYSPNRQFTTLPTAPTGVTASSDNSSRVTISWTATSAAASYEVLRDGISIGTNIAQTTFNDTRADPPTVSAPVVTASKDIPTHVQVSWAPPTTAPGTEHAYTVRAITADGEKSDPSAQAKGQRAPQPITTYKLSIDGGMNYADVGLTTTFNHTDAPKPYMMDLAIKIAPSYSVPEHNEIYTITVAWAHGTSVMYSVRAFAGSIQSERSDYAHGNRTLDSDLFRHQWQSSTSPGPFIDIDGGTDHGYTDPSPSGKKFRLVLSHEGGYSITSNTVTSQ